MKRQLFQQLIEWKMSPVRKPLLLEGARQVGKTYLLKQFAKEAYHAEEFSVGSPWIFA